MPELIRVKDATTGHEFSWPAHLAEGVEGVERLDKPAVDTNGERLPAKHKTTVAKSAAAKKATAPSPAPIESGQQADPTV